MNKRKSWVQQFEDHFLSQPGEHLIEIGITGSGKTQGLYWVLDGILKNSPDEVIVWFDSGKSNEILSLARLRPLNVIIPEGTEINITASTQDIKVTKFKSLSEIWTKHLDTTGRINIACIEPYVIEPMIYTKAFTKLFGELIKLAHNYEVPSPMCIFVDEFHRLAPSKGNAIDAAQMKMGGVLQHNIELLRSLKIRFVCTTHGWQKIRSGVRNSFNWIMVRRGAHFAADQPKLNRFNPLFEKLTTDESILTFPTKTFTDVLRLPFYGEGGDMGKIRYLELYDPKK